MSYDPIDNAKVARQRMSGMVFEEAWNLLAKEFHLPNAEAERKAFSKLLAMVVDSHVKTGLEHAGHTAYNVFTEMKRKYFS